ncbi:MAG: hypothetical protein WC455_15475 [Dehalococcoidia bacterium]|jgi:hypothetical protein
MATSVFGSPVKKLYGETVSLTTTAAHLGFMPKYHEVKIYCASDYRLGIAPRLARAKVYAASAYTDYTAEVTDRVSTTHMPLDGMTTAKYVYLGVTEPTRGFYINPVSNVNAEAATLDWEYMYDVSDGLYSKLTGTVSGALTVGETITGSTSGATGTCVYGPAGSTYIVVKSLSKPFILGENAAGATQACNTLTAIAAEPKGTGYFTDVAADSDGTDSGGATLAVPGLYAFTLPSVVRGPLAGVDGDSLYWYRFAPSATLSATVDIVDIIPACDTTNYGYEQGGVVMQFALNTVQNGAFEFDHTTSATLYVDWISH